MSLQGYFDYNATTPVCPEAINAFVNAAQTFGNPSSKYGLAKPANALISEAREHLSRLIGCATDEIFFTSGGTESNNWAIKGVFLREFSIAPAERVHIIVSALEHSSILEVVGHLERTFHCEVTRLNPDNEGIISADSVRAVLRPNTRIVSVMLANNEVGSIQPIWDIAQVLRHRKIHFHVDAVQAVGKIKVDVQLLGIDTLSFSGHKFYGPKGCGGLYIRRGITLEPLIHGGGQERGYRGGTEAVATIVAMGAAAKLANEQLEENLNRFSTYSALLRKLLVQKIPSIIFNGPKSSSAQVPNTVSICVPGIRAEALAALLDSLNGIQVSLGSACSNNKTMSLSHVLLSMGLSEEDVKSTLRVSLGLYTREEDILSFAEAVANAVGILNRISRPVSEDYVFAS